MRAREFIREDSGATTSGSVATMTMPMGGVISRQLFPKPAKYANSIAKRKKHARR